MNYGADGKVIGDKWGNAVPVAYAGHDLVYDNGYVGGDENFVGGVATYGWSAGQAIEAIVFGGDLGERLVGGVWKTGLSHDELGGIVDVLGALVGVGVAY